MQFSFDEKTGAAEVSIDQLRRTMAVGQFDGKMPTAVPLVHSELIDTFHNKMKSVGLPLTIPPIVIRERYCRKNQKAPDNNPEHYLVNRLVGKILIDDPKFKGTDDNMLPGISFSYVYDTGLRGIQVAFGTHVSVCDNLTCFGEFHFSTNGNSKVPFEKGLQLLDGWLQNYAVNMDTYVTKVKELQAVELSEYTINTLVGDLFTRAVRSNNNIKDGERTIQAPLNQSEISAMVAHGFDRKIKSGKTVTGWDFLNWGTKVLKPHSDDMTNLIGNTVAFNDYVYQALCVPIGEVSYSPAGTPKSNPVREIQYSPGPADIF